MNDVTILRVINTCVLIEIGGHFVLTDPYFASRWFFRTNESIGLSPGELPMLSAILGGHRALDHWQPKSMSGYESRSTTAVFTASRGMTRAARRAGFDHVETLEWDDRREIEPDLKLTCLPGQRTFGMRSNMYLLETGCVSMLIGTEALDPHAIERCAAQHRVDVAMLPIDGATFLRRQLVMNAADAIVAVKTLGASALVPVHHSERPIPGLLRCPTGIDDLQQHAQLEPDIHVYTAPTGTPLTVKVDPHG